jgi:NADH-quinone oxidoreductase subunit K
MHLVYPTVLAALLFCIGMYGVLARRNAVLVLMSIEIMLNAVNINLVAFNAYLQDTLLQGQMFALFVITVAAAEVGVGLAIVLLIFRNRETVDIDSLREMGDTGTPLRRTTAAGDAPREEVPAHRG